MDEVFGIDQNKVEILISKIVVMENQNEKTHNKSDIQMITDIQKAIEEAVQCYSNQ